MPNLIYMNAKDMERIDMEFKDLANDPPSIYAKKVIENIELPCDEEDKEADITLIVSNETIENVMLEYFNNELFKKQVEVVESKPIPGDSGGYAFSLRFNNLDEVRSRIAEREVLVKHLENEMQKMTNKEAMKMRGVEYGTT